MAGRMTRANTWSDADVESIYDLNHDEPGGKTRRLLNVMKAIRHCNKAPDLKSALRLVVKSTCEVLECEHATLFMVDENSDELVVESASNGSPDIRLPLDSPSIAAAVYHSGDQVNIHDAQEDPLFNNKVDETTGILTKSVLCVPIMDGNFEPIAVIQAINKHSGQFTCEDELLVGHLSLQVGVILRNQLLLEESKRSHSQVLSLLDIVKSLHSDLGINSLMFTITERCPSLVNAERCTLYKIDRKHKELWSLQGAVEIRVPMDTGLIGYTATTGEILNIEDAHSDSRFNYEVDKSSGYKTKSVLVMPIKNKPHDGSAPVVVGVLQLINKQHGPRFLQEDESMLGSFLDIVGSLLVTSQLFQYAEHSMTEFGAAQDLNVQAPRTPKTPPLFYHPDSITEGEEGEEEGEEEY